ncbi:hypothetical protein GEMRC1_010228 [Eukaryota sp. GEM-RC1]
MRDNKQCYGTRIRHHQTAIPLNNTTRFPASNSFRSLLDMGLWGFTERASSLSCSSTFFRRANSSAISASRFNFLAKSSWVSSSEYSTLDMSNSSIGRGFLAPQDVVCLDFMVVLHSEINCTSSPSGFKRSLRSASLLVSSGVT